MAAADVVRARIDAGLKKEAADVLGTMGLSVSEAIRMMLVRVVADRRLPFEVRAPSHATAAALAAAARGEVARFATIADLMADLNDDEDQSKPIEP